MLEIIFIVFAVLFVLSIILAITAVVLAVAIGLLYCIIMFPIELYKAWKELDAQKTTISSQNKFAIKAEAKLQRLQTKLKELDTKIQRRKRIKMPIWFQILIVVTYLLFSPPFFYIAVEEHKFSGHLYFLCFALSLVAIYREHRLNKKENT